MIRVGIIGYGGMGHLHAGNLLQMKGVRITAVCDIDTSKFRQDKPTINIAGSGKTLDMGTVETFTDGRAMFASGLIDAVVSTLPTHEHARYAVWALQAGLHVFSEKPMARTSGECATMLAAAKRARRVLMIGQCIRFWPGWDTVKEYMRSGKLGKLESLRLDRHGAVPGWLKHDNWFIDEKRSGGCVLDLHLHDADYVNFLLGMPRAVQAVGVYDPKRGGWSEIDAHYIYPSGVSIGLRGSWDHHTPFFMKMRAGFKKGVLEHGKDGAMLYPVGGKPRKLNMSPQGGHYLEMVYFLDRARKNKPPAICPPDACAESVRLIEATVKAMETGTTVKL
jgi:predicted dehydrogenase